MRNVRQGYLSGLGPALCAILLVMACSEGQITTPPPAPPAPPTPPAPPAPAPIALHISAVSAQVVVGAVGTTVSPAPTVRVTDSNGNPVSDIVVQFRTFNTADSTKTDASGLASMMRWTLPMAPQTTGLSAAIPDGTTILFNATALAGPPNEMVSLDTIGPLARPGTALRREITVRLRDYYGNPVPGARVHLTALDGGGSVDSIAITNAAGIAVGETWTLGPTPGVQHVEAEFNGMRVFFAALATITSPELAYSRNGSIIYSDSAGTQNVLTSGFQDYDPAWSPDGRYIAFTRLTGSLPDVYVMHADGTGLMRLTFSQPGSSNYWTPEIGMHTPSWSPDGKRLAVATGGTYYGTIRTIDAFVPNAPTERIATDGGAPAWSPTGNDIAFVGLSGDDGYNTLDIVSADGSRRRELVGIDAFGSGLERPAWSPDGDRLAFTKCGWGTCGLYILSTAGALQRRTPTEAHSAAWSPDGEFIAFTIYIGSYTNPTIGIISAAGDDGPYFIGAGVGPAWRPRVR